MQCMDGLFVWGRGENLNMDEANSIFFKKKMSKSVDKLSWGVVLYLSAKR